MEEPQSKLMCWVNIAACVILGSSVAFGIWQWEWIVTDMAPMESGSTTLRNLGLVAGGLIAIWVAIWRGVVADRQAKASQQQAEISRHSLLNERYQKGAEMLGNEVLSVRLGGIYALDLLACENPGIFHLQVMKLFAAFVVDRTRSETAEQVGTIMDPAPSESEEPSKSALASFSEGSDDTSPFFAADRKVGLVPGLTKDVEELMRLISERDDASLFFAADRKVGPVPRLTKDVEEVMRLISERDEKRIALESNEKIRMNLADASLPGLIFHEANFSNFNFTKADLRRVRGWDARLTKAVLPGADLSGANLHGADFRDADMRRVNLTAARLRGADLRNANLCLVDLVSQNLWKGATFPTKLVGTRLEGADLRKADLSGADMRGASLAGAKLDGTDMRGVKGLTQEQLDQAYADPDNPPNLGSACDAKTGTPLQWRGKPCRQ